MLGEMGWSSDQGPCDRAAGQVGQEFWLLATMSPKIQVLWGNKGWLEAIENQAQTLCVYMMCIVHVVCAYDMCAVCIVCYGVCSMMCVLCMYVCCVYDVYGVCMMCAMCCLCVCPVLSLPWSLESIFHWPGTYHLSSNHKVIAVPRGSFCLHLSTAVVTGACTPVFLSGCWGFKLRSSRFHSKHHPMSHLSRLLKNFHTHTGL